MSDSHSLGFSIAGAAVCFYYQYALLVYRLRAWPAALSPAGTGAMVAR